MGSNTQQQTRTHHHGMAQKMNLKITVGPPEWSEGNQKACLFVEFPNCQSTTTQKPFKWMPTYPQLKEIEQKLEEVERDSWGGQRLTPQQQQKDHIRELFNITIHHLIRMDAEESINFKTSIKLLAQLEKDILQTIK